MESHGIFPHFSSLPFEAQPQQAGQHRQQFGAPVPEDAAQGTQRCGEEAHAEEEPWLGRMHGTVQVGWLVKKWGWKPLKHGIYMIIYIYNWIGLTTKTWNWYIVWIQRCNHFTLFYSAASVSNMKELKRNPLVWAEHSRTRCQCCILSTGAGFTYVYMVMDRCSAMTIRVRRWWRKCALMGIYGSLEVER